MRVKPPEEIHQYRRSLCIAQASLEVQPSRKWDFEMRTAIAIPRTAA